MAEVCVICVAGQRITCASPENLVKRYTTHRYVIEDLCKDNVRALKLRLSETPMSIEQFAVLYMKWMGLQHEANYCVSTPEDARRLKKEIDEVEGEIRVAPWKVVKGEIVPE